MSGILERNMYKDKLEKVKQHYIAEKLKRDALVDRCECLEKDIKELSEKQESMEVQKGIIIKASDKARENGKALMEDLCTEAINEINANTKVTLETSIKHGTPSMEVILKTEEDGKVTETDPAQEDAGGISDLVSMSALMALNQLDEANSAPIFLDEPTKFVSRNNAELSARFLKEMSENSNKQIFVVTHEQEIMPEYADAKFKVEKDNGVSKVTKIA